jgi:hypothetical protein
VDALKKHSFKPSNFIRSKLIVKEDETGGTRSMCQGEEKYSKCKIIMSEYLKRRENV